MGKVPIDCERAILRMFGEKVLLEVEADYEMGSALYGVDFVNKALRELVEFYRKRKKDPFDVKV